MASPWGSAGANENAHGSVHEDIHGNAHESWALLCQTRHGVPTKTPTTVLTGMWQCTRTCTRKRAWSIFTCPIFTCFVSCPIPLGTKIITYCFFVLFWGFIFGNYRKIYSMIFLGELITVIQCNVRIGAALPSLEATNISVTVAALVSLLCGNELL